MRGGAERVELGEQRPEVEGEELVTLVGEDEQLEKAEARRGVVAARTRGLLEELGMLVVEGAEGRDARSRNSCFTAACRAQHSSTGAEGRTVTRGPGAAAPASSSEGIVI